MMARDGIEPPTPSFSWLRSARHFMEQIWKNSHVLVERSPLNGTG